MIAMACLPNSEEEQRARGGGAAMRGVFEHVPVLLHEVMACLQPGPGKLFVDGTLGGGGHSSGFLEAGATVVGIDQDWDAVATARHRLGGYGERFQAVHASFAEVGSVLASLGIERIDGALLDLGVSSHQLNTPERGFSFQADGPLDMRMNSAGPVKARDLVNTASAEQLEKIFREFGEEPQARRIAARVVRDRAVRPFLTTFDLVRSVESVIPRRGKAHPATRVFQALRIAVNRELEALMGGLDALSRHLAPGGRLGIISFHSLEDRGVKQFFQLRTSPTLDRPDWPAPRPNPDWIFRKVTGKPVVAADEELQRNPRARSAKLRVVERLPARIPVSPPFPRPMG
jgi:16S rRNA (cytosine1402-N4)-methyltransferase